MKYRQQIAVISDKHIQRRNIKFAHHLNMERPKKEELKKYENVERTHTLVLPSIYPVSIRILRHLLGVALHFRFKRYIHTEKIHPLFSFRNQMRSSSSSSRKKTKKKLYRIIATDSTR